MSRPVHPSSIVHHPSSHQPSHQAIRSTQHTAIIAPGFQQCKVTVKVPGPRVSRMLSKLNGSRLVSSTTVVLPSGPSPTKLHDLCTAFRHLFSSNAINASSVISAISAILSWAVMLSLAHPPGLTIVSISTNRANDGPPRSRPDAMSSHGNPPMMSNPGNVLFQYQVGASCPLCCGVSPRLKAKRQLPLANIPTLLRSILALE